MAVEVSAIGSPEASRRPLSGGDQVVLDSSTSVWHPAPASWLIAVCWEAVIPLTRAVTFVALLKSISGWTVAIPPSFGSLSPLQIRLAPDPEKRNMPL